MTDALFFSNLLGCFLESLGQVLGYDGCYDSGASPRLLKIKLCDVIDIK